jgi:hypothetical protein
VYGVVPSIDPPLVGFAVEPRIEELPLLVRKGLLFDRRTIATDQDPAECRLPAALLTLAPLSWMTFVP